MLFPTLFFLLLGCFVSWILIQVLLSLNLCPEEESAPQAHHTHEGCIPRIGGLGLMAGFTATYLLCFFFLDTFDNRSLIHYSIFAGGGAAFLLGFIDDYKPLGAKVKLLAQVIIAMSVHECGLAITSINLPVLGGADGVWELGFLSLPVTVLWFVGMMNLINLIDGIDGLAGGIGLMLMTLLAFVSEQGSVPFPMILAIGMVGAILGFLFHNFPPAQVYMGDSGAYLLGFVIAALSLLNAEKGTVLAALLAPLLALALPIADVSLAILRRALKGLPLFRPDRNHIHHRLLRSGLSRRGTVLVLYGISLIALVAALLFFTFQGRHLAILLGAGFTVLLVLLRGNKITFDSVTHAVMDSLETRGDARNAMYLKDWFVNEVERADSGKNLWSDFRFVLKKMGLCRAELTIGNETRAFYLPNTPHDQADALRSETHSLNGGQPVQLTVYGESENFSPSQFSLVGEIAFEAWTKASERWKQLHGKPLDFTATATDPQNSRKRKNRSLYRPAY